MLDGAFSFPPPSLAAPCHPFLDNLASTFLPTSAFKSQWDLSKTLLAASALHRSIPVYSFPLASPPLFTFFQVPKTLRLDGATREEGKFPLGNQRAGWPGTHPGTVAVWLFTQFKNKLLPLSQLY